MYGLNTVKRLISIGLKGLGITAALIFFGAIWLANHACPWLACQGPDLDAWMLPFALAPIGIPAVLASLVFTIRFISTRSRPAP